MEVILPLLIPIIAIVLGLGVGAWAIYWEYQKAKLRHEERRLMIEKGLPLPPDQDAEKKLVTPEDCLRRGVIMFFLGIGLGLAALVVHSALPAAPPAWLLGVGAAIVGLLGLGYLVYFFIARNRAPFDDADG